MAVVNLDMDVTERALAAAHASRTVERVLTYSLEDAAADVFVPPMSAPSVVFARRYVRRASPASS
ncbi:MAG: hypothetical protein ACLTSX_10960 [Collinsella sp.]